MKNIVVVGMASLFIFTTTMTYADIIHIPRATKVKQFVEESRRLGLDLSGSDESDGFVNDRGTEIEIVTYRNMTLEELEIIKESAFKAVR